MMVMNFSRNLRLAVGIEMVLIKKREYHYVIIGLNFHLSIQIDQFRVMMRRLILMTKILFKSHEL